MSVETESTSWKNTSKKSNKKHDRKAKASDNMSGDKSEKKADHSAHSAATDKSANARSEPLPENVKAVMDLTLKSEDEVVMALHVADGDLDRAVNDLLEGVSPEWEIKKKKARPAAGAKQTSDDAPLDNHTGSDYKHQYQADSSARGRGGRANHGNRGWRRQENKENEKNVDTTNEGNSNHGVRGRFSGKASRGGRGGGRNFANRSYGNRGSRSQSNSQVFSNRIETWTGVEEEKPEKSTEPPTNSWKTPEVVEDWDAEEYTGSLADSKVFIPSTFVETPPKPNETEEPAAVKTLEMPQKTAASIKPRPRKPPPSKIPSSAVEMPGDTLNSNIGLLDVQFGALEFGTDSSILDASPPQDKVDTSSIKSSTSSGDHASVKNTLKNLCSFTTEPMQPACATNFGTSPKIVTKDISVPNEVHINSQGSLMKPPTSTQNIEMPNQNINSSSMSTVDYKPNTNYQQSAKSYQMPTSGNNYSNFTPKPQPMEETFGGSAKQETKNFRSINSTSLTNYNSSYAQSYVTTFSQTAPTSTAAIYNQAASNKQEYQSSGFPASVSQYQAQSTSTSTSSNNLPFMSTGYPSSTSFQSAQSYQPTTTTYAMSMNHGPASYSNSVQSVYSKPYSTYTAQEQNDNKGLSSVNSKFDGDSSHSSAVSVSTSNTMGISASSSVNTLSKTTATNAMPKSTTVGLGSGNNSNSSTGSGSTGNVTPILGHQYVVGQTIPAYATFQQQPAVYTYEELQMLQQRLNHMPNSAYHYDATLGYQTSGPVTSLGNSRNDSVSTVQNVQGQFSSMNDARFTRTDGNSSPVSSTVSQQNTSQQQQQHQQPLMNPIPPGYAYFYGGSIMPASGFPYNTAPTLYPQMPTTAGTGSNSSTYPSKSGNYSSGYNTGSNYDAMTNAGSAADYKNSSSGYSQTGKNIPATCSPNTINPSDISPTIYSKGHTQLNKTYEKQNFHSATPPPFGMTNNQTAGVIGGYNATHMFIPTVPHQLHQALHQDSGSNTVQRSNNNPQNKVPLKNSYTSSYWTGSN
ncbi:protein lingerer isoform X1 [Trichogramma pretiosum]|uniref:protein lingerer isoform X1 n=1 Tax=Trichogramma pretiosum TaxID=7493 RepID=UPI0006C9D4BD|nr:protein lingerer isoform X1 [Trichogramma pretiosum]XP_014234159.1 protein lingerer isoform X1 [Trichogramma pretiosum]XP_014234166.1 protein lingerer isoform X1 [Trichogramma pretiosum]XP_014234175.1 protein lingerer isoform X1 [Trichogramma pretiosum]XP_023318499.1 protein lingerer isoform X1 [Trichogramma pretiosum]